MYHYMVQEDIWKHTTETIFGNLCRPESVSNKEGVSLFIGIRGIIGTLTTFLGLLTDFKRKLGLTVVAIPSKAGTLMR